METQVKKLESGHSDTLLLARINPTSSTQIRKEIDFQNRNCTKEYLK